MKILAVEFSSERRSVAIVADGVVLGQAAEVGGRITRALTLTERALAEAKLEREDIECIAVGLGPGSYTGIRAGISLAQGWQVARDVKLLGLGVIEVLAAQAQARKLSGRVNFLIDAQRNEFYFAAFDLTASERHVIEPLRLVTFDEARAQVQTGALVVWPELSPKFPGSHAFHPDAAMLGQLAASRRDFTPGETLEPIYLRETSFVKAPPARVIAGF